MTNIVKEDLLIINTPQGYRPGRRTAFLQRRVVLHLRLPKTRDGPPGSTGHMTRKMPVTVTIQSGANIGNLV